jgi:hypothetical protein
MSPALAKLEVRDNSKMDSSFFFMVRSLKMFLNVVIDENCAQIMHFRMLGETPSLVNQ